MGRRVFQTYGRFILGVVLRSRHRRQGHRFISSTHRLSSVHLKRRLKFVCRSADKSFQVFNSFRRCVRVVYGQSDFTLRSSPAEGVSSAVAVVGHTYRGRCQLILLFVVVNSLRSLSQFPTIRHPMFGGWLYRRIRLSGDLLPAFRPSVKVPYGGGKYACIVLLPAPLLSRLRRSTPVGVAKTRGARWRPMW